MTAERTFLYRSDTHLDEALPALETKGALTIRQIEHEEKGKGSIVGAVMMNITE